MKDEILNKSILNWKQNIKQKYIKIKQSLFKSLTIKNRKTWILFFSLLGFILAFLLTNIALFFMESLKIKPIINKILPILFFIFLLSPVSFYLWYIRNYDKLTQIEQIRKNNYFNYFIQAMSLFLEKNNIEKKQAGLKLLMKLKNEEKQFVKEIQLSTFKIYLPKAQLIGADLRQANLQEAYLQKAKLWNANLKGATLVLADLREAELFYTNLQDTILLDTILDKVKIIIKKEQLHQTFQRAELEDFLRNLDTKQDIENEVHAKVIKEHDEKYLLKEIFSL